MPIVWLVASGVVAAVAVSVMLIRDSRSRQLDQIRADWGESKRRVRKMDAIESAHRSRVAAAGTASLDDRTWDDLDLDAVFVALDRTESTLGQQALYHRLRTAPIADHLDAFDALVTRMSVDAPARERAQLALARLQDPLGYDLWWLARPETIEPQAWHAVFPALVAIELSVLIGAAFRPSLLWTLPVLLGLNWMIRVATDGRIGVVARAFRQLAPIIATGEALQFLSEASPGHVATALPEPPVVDPCVGTLAADVLPLKRLKTVARWVSGDPLMLSFSWNVLANLLTDVFSVVYEYLNLAFLLDANGVYFGARDLRGHGAALLRVIAAVGEVDAAISVASYRTAQEQWVRPHFRPPDAPAILTDVCHPLVVDAVPNTITLRPGHGVLVTGSNMSGKSTFLRTVGVTAVLAQTINTCLAAGYEAPIFAVRSCIGRTDDLIAGKSYYIAEVEALLALVTVSLSAAPHLFLLDELFRGTNAVERIAAGHAVLSEFLIGAAIAKPHVVIAATHDGELVDLLPDVFAAYHFGDAVSAEGLVFDHRLQPGPATSRNAIALLRIHGAPQTLLDRALDCATTLDRERGTTLGLGIRG